MDILLINGVDYQVKVTNPQIGQLILRDILKDKYEVECINFDYLAKKKIIKFRDSIWDNVELFAEIILAKKPKIVGFYTICNSFLTTLLLAKRIRALCPEIKIIFGGPQATLTARECLEDFSFVDVISMWEGEKTILPLVDALLNNDNLESLRGIAYRKGNEIVITPRVDLIANDELANYTPTDYSPVEIDKNSPIELEAGRGCPFACTFCSTSPFWGRKFRIKSVDELIDEMNEFHELYGVNEFSLVHDMFTVNRKHLEEFCNRIINDKLPYVWGCSSRVDVLDKEILELMKEAHCKGIYLGIETGSPSMQKKINKNLNLDHALSMITEIQRLGMDFTASFIYGYPEESIEEFRETIQMIEKIFLTGDRQVQLHRFMLLPHTLETDNVFDRAYFDEFDVDFSIYDDKLYDDRAKEVIKKYNREFIQFYTFHSEVREKYKFFDCFEFYIGSAMAVYNCSIRFLLKKDGMENLYFKYVKQIEEVRNDLLEMNIDDGAQLDSGMTRIYELVEYMIKTELRDDYSIELEQIGNFEELLRQYSEGDREKPKYYKLGFDVIKKRKNLEYDPKECVVRVYYKNDRLRVEKIKVDSMKKEKLLA